MKPILQVEDEENDVLFFKLAAQKAGILHPIQIARDGREALAYLRSEGKFMNREQYPQPCLVLLDLKLPQMPGLEVLKSIRQEPACGRPIVVVFSSSDLDVDVDQAYALGANSYVVKPATPGELQQIVVAIRDYWLSVNRFGSASHESHGNFRWLGR